MSLFTQTFEVANLHREIHLEIHNKKYKTRMVINDKSSHSILTLQEGLIGKKCSKVGK